VTHAARDRGPDSTLGLALAGYEFISGRCARHGTDVFQTRLLGQRTVCLRGGQEVELFVQEVRRFYPFFPLQGARVRTPFDWQGVHFPVGRRVLLDLYGTDHHPQLWEKPDRFDPDRFRGWDGGAYDFIPQGGGDHHTGHRCPGEWITIELMKRAVTILTGEMDYDVPDQDLRVSLRRIPTLPASRFVIANVRPTA